MEATNKMTIDRFDGKYHFLSNFHEEEVSYNGHIYPSAEHAYQAAKAVNGFDHNMICMAISPAVAKKMGRKIKVRPDWNDVKIQVMKDILKSKFAKGTKLSGKLAETYPSDLIEGNWWGDCFWGVCNGIGDNNLGKILMEIRAELLVYNINECKN